MIMRDTVYARGAPTPTARRSRPSVRQMIVDVQKYVPGYRLCRASFDDLDDADRSP